VAFLPPAALVTESACSSRLLHDRIQYTLSSEFIPTTGRLIDQFLPSIVSSYLNGKWMEPGGRYVPSGGWAPAIYGFLPGVMYCFLPFLSTILDADVLLYSTWPSNDSCLLLPGRILHFFRPLAMAQSAKSTKQSRTTSLIHTSRCCTVFIRSSCSVPSRLLIRHLL